MKSFLKFGGLVLLVISLHVATHHVLQGSSALAGDCEPGDVNGSGAVTLNDAITILNYLFLDGDAPVACAGDGSVFTDDEIEFLQEFASHVSMLEVEDPEDEDLTYTTVLFEECNVQIVNGLGATNGDSSDPRATTGRGVQVNGLGNLIVGYNLTLEDADLSGTDNRTGSHNVVVGALNSYSSFGGIVAGLQSEATAPWASVVGGKGNVASGNFACAAGGWYNEASGSYSTALGGLGNSASGDEGSVLGGYFNEASGHSATATGGVENEASGNNATVTGGANNTASGGGATVSGGYGREAEGTYDWAAGSLEEDD